MASNFPSTIDTDTELYSVSDGLRVRLAEDYNPGDTSITIFGDDTTISRFSPTGIITLTDQCAEVDKRALSFYYASRTTTSFDGLVLLDGFIDNSKPKSLTNVTQNVMAEHHNVLKDALINIEKFAGIKGEVSTKPAVGTLEQRINYLRTIVLQPRAWFTVDKQVGLAPLAVKFTDQSFRLGTDGSSAVVKHIWDFGDNTTSVISFVSIISGISTLEVMSTTLSTISLTSYVPTSISNVEVEDIDGESITKVYTNPGIYTVKLTVINDFGEDSVIFDNLISARFPAPGDACIAFVARATQILVEPGVPSGGPYTTTPILRAGIGSIIDMYVPSGENPNTPGITFAGETIVDGSVVDPIESYTWSLSDDLGHGNSSITRAVFSVGGNYDLVLRCDTRFGAYKITTYDNAFDIVEKYNLWLWIYNTSKTQAYVNEFGLLSETFKAATAPLTLNVNQSFLVNTIANPVPNSTQQLREFNRNVGFAPRTATTSGNGGTGILYWASGRQAATSKLNEKILSTQFNGFSLLYTAAILKAGDDIKRPWNWIGMASPSSIYFILGNIPTAIPSGTSPTNQDKDVVSLQTLVGTNPAETLAYTNYKNGADELQQNEVTFDLSGNPNEGHMSVYRSCWSGDSGFFLRNQGTGQFFRIRSFYKTSGTTSEPFIDIRKLNDMSGPAKVEGQLVPMSTGVYFFNNSGSVAAYNSTTNVWATGGPGTNSPAFKALQDSTVVGFDSESQTLLAASDGDHNAYLSFDYSSKAFIKFSDIDLTFKSVTNRPSGSQWNMAIF